MNVTMFMSKCLWVPLTGVSSWNRIGDGKWSLIHIALIFNFFRSGRISSVYIVGCWLVGCGWVTLFQNLFILSVVVL